MDAAIGLAIATMALAASGAVTAFLQTRLLRRRDEVVPQKTLEDRLHELSESMQNSAQLVEQVSAELDARAATARRLQDEAKAAEALAAIHKEQAEAIRRLMDAELQGAARRIRRDSIWISIASFIAGGAVSFLVTLLVHPLQ